MTAVQNPVRRRSNWIWWLLIAIAVLALLAGLFYLGRATAQAPQAPAPTAVAPPVAEEADIPVAPVAPPATVTATPTATVTAITWPETPIEAAATFGGNPDRWEITPDGGWHLMEAHTRTVINPAGFTGEGYYDTNPGKDPRQMVFVVAMEVQGCTIWPLTPDNAQELFDAMAQQKRYTVTQAEEFIDKVGW